MRHLLAVISPHGFGHLAMVAPILNALRQKLPNLKLSIRTTLPHAIIRRRIEGEFTIDTTADDFGMVQSNSLVVDVEQSCHRYRQFHHDWDQRVDRVAQELRQINPDLIFANAPYLTLAAAKKAGIAAVGFSCLNWYDISRFYCKQPHIQQQILNAYNSADSFICPEPTMPMDDFNNRVNVGTVATVGQNRRDELVKHLGIDANKKLILTSLGGIDYHCQIDQWDQRDDLHFLVPQGWHIQRQNVTNFESIPMAQPDLIASVDLIITKPGYGTTTEVAAVGTPMLYIARPDWPEQPYIIEWMQRNIHCQEISEQQLRDGTLLVHIDSLLERGRSKPVEPKGVTETVNYLLNHYCHH